MSIRDHVEYGLVCIEEGHTRVVPGELLIAEGLYFGNGSDKLSVLAKKVHTAPELSPLSRSAPNTPVVVSKEQMFGWFRWAESIGE